MDTHVEVEVKSTSYISVQRSTSTCHELDAERSSAIFVGKPIVLGKFCEQVDVVDLLSSTEV